jgi:hypothetical protein
MGVRCRALNSSLTLWFLPFAVAVAGCRSSDLVEAELRSRNTEVRQLTCELQRLQAENQALARESVALRQDGGLHVPPEIAGPVYALKRITLGRFTGGYADDISVGDVALRVVLEPRDSDDQSVKAPGALHVEALQITPEGLKTPLSTWDLDPLQLRRTWKSGLFSNAYTVILPWNVWPASDRLRIVVQFRLSDGRVFEADRDVTVHLARRGVRPGLPAPGPVEGPSFPVPRTDEPLPFPPPRSARSNGWRRSFEVPPWNSGSQGPVTPAAAWMPSEPEDLSNAVQVRKPVPQTPEEWPPH